MKRPFRTDLSLLCILAVFAALLYGFRMGSLGLIDPDEPFYALTAKEMIARGDPSTPVLFGAPQFEKPIFFYWVLYLCGTLFGMTEAAMRLGPCVAGVLTVVVTYGWARLVWKRPAAAFLSAAFLMTAGEFVVLSRLVLTDVFLCLFTTSAFACFAWGREKPRARGAAWTLLFAAAGLGVLTKGPLGALIPALGIAAALAASGETALLARLPWKRGLAVFAAIAAPWYALMAVRHGAGFLSHFFVHENVRRFFVAEHRGMDHPLFYPALLLLAFFPWTALLPGAIARACRVWGRPSGARERFLLASAAAPLAFFTMADSKLPSYVLPLFPPLAVLAGGWALRVSRALRRFAPRRAFVVWAAAVWTALPVVLVAGAFSYGASRGFEAALALPLAAAGAAFVPGAAAPFFLALRRPRAAAALVFATAFAVSAVAFGWLMPASEAHFSSRKAASERRAPDGRPPFFLASKMLFRGVSFYSGTARIGVLGDNGEKAFYTKPSLPFFARASDLERIPDADFPVYAFVRLKEVRLLRRFVQDGYALVEIESDGQKALVRLERTGAPR